MATEKYQGIIKAAMLRVAATQTRKRNKRAELLDLAMDVEYVARKAKALARNITGDDGPPKPPEIKRQRLVKGLDSFLGPVLGYLHRK